MEDEEQLAPRSDLPLDTGLLLHRGVYCHVMNTEELVQMMKLM